MEQAMLLRQINTDSSTSSCYDINDIARRFLEMKPGFVENFIDFANKPHNLFLRNELRGDIRFENIWNKLRNDSCRL